MYYIPMDKRIIFVFVALILSSTFIFADTLIDSGSFEDGVFSADWNTLNHLGNSGLFLDWTTAPTNRALILKNESFTLVDDMNICFSWKSFLEVGDPAAQFRVLAANDYNGTILLTLNYFDSNNALNGTKTCFIVEDLPTNVDSDPALDGITRRKIVLTGSHSNSASSGIEVGKFVDFNFTDGVWDANLIHHDSGGLIRKIEIDNITFNQLYRLTNTITEPDEPVDALTDFNVLIKVLDSNLNDFVSDATVTVSFNSGSFESVSFNSDANAYVYTNSGGAVAGDYNIAVNSSKTNFFDDYDEFEIEIRKRLDTGKLIITNIDNISNTINAFNVELDPTNENNDFKFSANNTDENALIVDFNIINSLDDGKQYFIYTADSDANYSLDDTLTFGGTLPIQKIYDVVNDRYIHSFEDTLAGDENKFYKLTYKRPMRYWKTMPGDEWFRQLIPSADTVDEQTTDIFTVSSFSNMRNFLIEPLPEIAESDFRNYEIQFTAWASANVDICAGFVELGDVSSITEKECITLTTSKKRYSLSVFADSFESQLILYTDEQTTSKTIYILDYALVQRGYFKQRLELRTSAGDPLPVFLNAGFSQSYLQEGKQFRAISEAYDREGDLNKLEVEIFLDSTAAANKVKVFEFPITPAAETTVSLNQLLDQIIDLNTSASTIRSLRVKYILKDTNNFTVSTQSKWVTFLQYPYFPGDIKLNFFPTEKRKGKHPTGIVDVRITEPSNLLGFDFRIYSDTNTVDSPNFQETIYKDVDFSCLGTNCFFQVSFSNYIFEDINLTTITVFALLSTEYLDQDNNLTRVDRRIFITPINLDVLKIHQVSERTDKTYRNDEEIPLVLILRDDEVTNVSSKIETYITLQNCDAASAGNCVDQTIQYKPTGHLYDDKLGVNYFFFRHLFILDNGDLLPDANYIGFRANIEDKTGVRSSEIAVLADRCQDQNYSAEFLDVLGNPVGIGSFLFNSASNIITSTISGCQADSEQFDKVTTLENNSEEIRLLIDDDHSRTSPSQTLFFCVAPDTNAIIDKPLEQDFVCVSWYETAEKPIDDFRVIITNQYSDLSAEGSVKQFKEFNAPYELIAINDPQILKAQLETNQSTTIDTVGDFFYYGLRGLAKGFIVGSGLQDQGNFILGNGIITNVGADFDFTQDFNAATVPGAIFFRLKGIPVTNIQDFRFNSTVSDNFDLIDRKSFLEYLAMNEITVPENTATMELFVSDATTPFKITDSQGSLVIDEEASRKSINQNNADANQTVRHRFIPNELTFTLQNTMFFNNFSENDSRSLIMRIPVVIQDAPGAGVMGFVNEFIGNPVEAIISLVFENILIIVIILMVMIIFAYVERKRNGNQNF